MLIIGLEHTTVVTIEQNETVAREKVGQDRVGLTYILRSK